MDRVDERGVTALADHPDELVSLVETLARLWHRGICVGDLPTIVLSCRGIRDPERRQELESRFLAPGFWHYTQGYVRLTETFRAAVFVSKTARGLSRLNAPIG